MKRHQDREKSSKLPDPLRSKAEEVWSGNETSNADVQGSIPTASMLFFIFLFLIVKLSFFALQVGTLDDP